jgi:hypothetical protein
LLDFWWRALPDPHFERYRLISPTIFSSIPYCGRVLA